MLPSRCVTPYPRTGPTLLSHTPRWVPCHARTLCRIRHHSSGLNPSPHPSRPVARHSHHHLESHATSHPSPFPAGCQSQRREGALSFVCPGLHKGKKRLSCVGVSGRRWGHCVAVPVVWTSHVMHHGLCAMGRGTVVREERCVGRERVNVERQGMSG